MRRSHRGRWSQATRETGNPQGQLTAATKPPVGRVVMLSKLEEVLIIDGRRYELSANQYPGVIHPQGFRLQTGFRLDPPRLKQPAQPKRNSLFQVANTWTKITARDVYAMVRNGQERENLYFLGGCNFRKGKYLSFCR